MRTVAILTTSAHATMRMLHKRLPVVLQERDQPRWLGEVDDDTGRLMYPTGDNLLHLWPVSRAVNSVRNNGVEPGATHEIFPGLAGAAAR